MKVEVLASVMNTTLPETVEHMNLQSDAVIINQCDRLTYEEMKIAAAKALASLVSDEELSADYIIPKPFDPRVGKTVAAAVAQAARDSGVARI